VTMEHFHLLGHPGLTREAHNVSRETSQVLHEDQLPMSDKDHYVTCVAKFLNDFKGPREVTTSSTGYLASPLESRG